LLVTSFKPVDLGYFQITDGEVDQIRFQVGHNGLSAADLT
jgi:hypothetical protein